MRADRLLSILLLLQTRERMTARELAAQLEVSERTICRDMDALCIAGIPVISERGNNGGWHLLDGYRVVLNNLSPTEIQTLFLRQPLFADLGLEQTAENTLLKVFAALPALHRVHAEAMRQRLYIDLTGWQRSKEDVSWLPVIQEALWQDRKLVLNYRRSDNEEVERLVDPLGLVAKGRVWYLVAAVEDEIQTYRVSRVQSATATDKSCVRPPGFDLSEYWMQSITEFFENLPRYPVVVRVSPQILARLRYAGTFVKIDQVSSPEYDGWSVVHLHFDTEEEAREFVLGFGTFIKVLDPPELCEKVIEMARAVIDFYPSNGPC
jgi:predicted DNA-binding transcriptional regulator YafY